MAALAPAVAASRGAVRTAIADLPTDAGLLVACSGGPDSMALAAAAAWVAPRLGHRVGLVTVDHQLQPDSDVRAQTLAEWARGNGFTPVVVSTVDVSTRTGGPEAAARDARYEALTAAAREHACTTVLLGHTRDDQAETVLLALVRGAGLRGLAGMPARRRWHGVTLARPLLGLAREQTRAACAALGLPTWEDPHNSDPIYRRTHARELLGTLTASLGPAVVGNLARTARLAAADAALLDELAAKAALGVTDAQGRLRVDGMAALPDALRARVLHAWARSLGASGAALSHRHVEALDALVTRWRGQGPTRLPGGIAVARRDGLLDRTEPSPYGSPDTLTTARPWPADEAGLPHG